MICDGCFERVKQAFIVRTELIDAEEQYFKILRDEEEQEIGESNVKEEGQEAGGLSDKEKGQEANGSGRLNKREPVSVKQGEGATNIPMEADTIIQECKICYKRFKGKLGLRCHLATAHDKGRFKCEYCSKMFYFKSNLKAHTNQNCMNFQQKLRNVKRHKKAR